MIPGITSGLSIVPDVVDPYFGNVVSLMHFEGANGSTSFIDETGKTWTASGAMVLSTAEKPFGTSSLSDPTAAAHLTTASSADFSYGTADFTIEFFARPSNLTGTKIWYDQRALLIQARPTIYAVGNNLRYFVSGSDRITGGAASVVINVWQHIAISRVSGSTRLFVDGVQKGSTFTDGTNYETSVVVLGQAGNALGGTEGFIGHTKELRVTKGVGRYAANFTPPSEAFPDS